MSTSTIKRNYLKQQLTRELTHTITDNHMMVFDGANPIIDYDGEEWGGDFQEAEEEEDENSGFPLILNEEEEEDDDNN